MSINVVKGDITPLRDKILITDMEFEEVRTRSGIYIPSQNGKVEGIKPRWGRVWAVGPDQEDVKVGEWIYVDHGRWTRGITVEDHDGNEIIVRMVDNKDILLSAETPPDDIYLTT
jgi:co-chaperonin GroES (HSP10)